MYPVKNCSIHRQKGIRVYIVHVMGLLTEQAVVPRELLLMLPQNSVRLIRAAKVHAESARTKEASPHYCALRANHAHYAQATMGSGAR